MSGRDDSDRERLKVTAPTILEQLGKDVELKVAYPVGNSRVYFQRLDGICDAEAEYFFLAMEKEDLRDGEMVTRLSVNLVRKDIAKDKHDVIGYVDSYFGKEREARGDLSQIHHFSGDLTEPYIYGKSKSLTDCLRALANKKEEFDVAVKVRDEWRGSEVGKILWLLNLAYLENQGVMRRIIETDASQGQRLDRPGKSFYQRMGAKPYKLVEEVYGRLESKQYLEASTSLTPEQVEFLRGIFFKIRRE